MFHRLWQLLRAVSMAAGALLLIVTFTPLTPWVARRLTTTWTDTDHAVRQHGDRTLSGYRRK